MSEQLAFTSTGWDALEREIDAHAAHVMIELRQMSKDAMEFINRSSGQRLHHLRVSIAEAAHELGIRPDEERRRVEEPI